MTEDASKIITYAIEKVLPEEAVKQALENHKPEKEVCVIAIGKAAWRMAKAASELLGDKIRQGVVVMKYGHCLGEIELFSMIEAGHPIPDDNSVLAAKKVLSMIGTMDSSMEIILLLSGGGSALFELPEQDLSLEDIQSCTDQLLKCGADITEINTIRKRLSSVKGGKLAALCKDIRIFQVMLSDVLGDDLGMIASGPAYPDNTSSSDVMGIIKKYGLHFPDQVINCLQSETPKEIHNVETVVTGNGRNFCLAAAKKAEELGYHAYIITTDLNCEAKEAGRFLASIAKGLQRKDGTSSFKLPCAIILGGETVVRVQGKGKGGRNQELALSGACGIQWLENTVLLSVSSDGTDGPTDAAGGMVTGETWQALLSQGIDPLEILRDNDSYHALKAVGGLIMTDPTGTNVNDLSMLLCR